MKQLLAEAAVARRASGNTASTSGRDAAAAAAAGGGGSGGQKGGVSAAGGGDKDWRLQAPAKRFMPEFKPGAYLVYCLEHMGLYCVKFDLTAVVGGIVSSQCRHRGVNVMCFILKAACHGAAAISIAGTSRARQDAP
jgi:hypothetical protein